MIHRILIPIVLGILLPYLWIDGSEGKKGDGERDA